MAGDATHHASPRSVPAKAAFLLPSSFLLLAFLYLWPLTLQPRAVPFAPRAQYSDLLITHLPNAAYIRDSLTRYGQWPLWNAQIFAGQPFAADPLAGMWYLPNWLPLIPWIPLPVMFNLLFVLHLAWAGYGLFLFLRAERLGLGPAFLGSAAFMGTPKLIAHLGAGHVSLVFAVAWTPWLLLAVRNAVVCGGLKRGALAGLCLALLFLADVRWAFYAAALAAAFWATRLRRSNPSADGRSGLLAGLAFAGIFFSVSAILSFPLSEFVRHSNRSALTLAEASAFSLPPRYLLGLLIPDLGGFHEWMTYVGVIPLMLAVLGALRRSFFWTVTVGVAAAFALGSNFILFPLLFRVLPGLGLLRVPPRAWFIVALGICILAAHGAQRLMTEIMPFLARRYLSHSHTPRRSPKPSRGDIPPYRFLLPVLFLLTLADLLRVNSTLLEARPLPGRTSGLSQTAAWIAAQPGLFRVYSPSYSLPLGDGLQHVDGVNPLQLASAVSFIETASGVKAHGYSVTVPAFESADLATANAEAALDAQQLGLLNVKYVAAEFPLTVTELALVQTFGRTRVYENTAARARAWMANGNRAEVREWSPNRILVHADGPGLLVLSEVAYPGWKARVNGTLTPIETVEGILRGVQVAEGPHQVVFEFRPCSLYFGAALSALGLAALFAIWRWAR
jgi:hypothetical protein